MAFTQVSMCCHGRKTQVKQPKHETWNLVVSNLAPSANSSTFCCTVTHCIQGLLTAAPIENGNEAVSRHWSSSHTKACNMKHSIMALVCSHKTAVLWVDLHLHVKHMHSCINSFTPTCHGPSQFDCAHTLDTGLHRMRAPHAESAVPVA